LVSFLELAPKGYQSLPPSSNFMNSDFGKLTFLALCLLAQEMLPLVSCLVGFKTAASYPYELHL
jgi:hypothetical protein